VYIVFAHIHPPTPFPWHLPTTHRTWSALQFSDFVEKERKKTKKMTFVLVWDKGSCTGKFLVIFPCTCVVIPIGSSPLFFFIRP
jgi:hypothetical protein